MSDFSDGTQPFGYVTYGDSGELTGSYFQIPPAVHAGILIPVSEAIRAEWCHYRANANRDGVEPAPPIVGQPIVPSEVTMRQARLALLAAGLLSQVDPAIASLPSPDRETAEIEWEYSGTVRRDWRLVAVLGEGLGLDSAGLDALFLAASLL